MNWSIINQIRAKNVTKWLITHKWQPFYPRRNDLRSNVFHSEVVPWVKLHFSFGFMWIDQLLTKLEPKMWKKHTKWLITHKWWVVSKKSWGTKSCFMTPGIWIKIFLPLSHRILSSRRVVLGGGQTHRWTDGQTDRQTDRQTDGQTHVYWLQ